MKDAGIYATFTIIETLLTVIVPYFPIKENIKIYKEELLKSKEKLVQVKQEYLEAKAKFDAWAKENPDLVVVNEEVVQGQIMED